MSSETESRRAFSNPVRSMFRGFFLVLLTVGVYLRYLFRKSGRNEEGILFQAQRAITDWSRHCLGCMGICLSIEGEVPEGPVLLCPNHATYLDVFAMGAACRTFFVSKADVEGWPGIGRVCVGSRNILVPRERRSAITEVNTLISDRLTQGFSVCVFLEGTTSANEDVLPFHASLVQSAIDAEIPLVPVGIRWSCRKEDVDIGEDVAYWKDDHVLGSHLFRVLGLSGVEVTVHFGHAIESASRDRKALAFELHEHVVGLAGFPN